MPQTDPVADLLRRTPAPDAVRAQAWDAFQQATSEDDLATRLQAIQMPDTAKAALWDLKASETPQAAAVEPPAPVAAPKGGAWTGMNFGVPLVVDAAKGAFAGLMSTAVHGGDVIRRLTGMERIKDDPQVQNLITPPQNAAGKVGFYGEQIGEFLAPGAMVAKAVSKAPMVARMGAEAALGAGVAGVQSGADPTAMTLGTLGGAVAPPVAALAKGAAGVVQRAAAGAKEGGIGGAIAAGVRSVAPSPPRTLLVQALKPRSTKVRFESSLDLAMPEIKAAEQAIGKPVASVDDLIEATKAAKGRIQEQLGVIRGGAEGFQVNLSPVADAMVESIPKKLRLENPEAALRLEQAANAYRKMFSLEDAETLLRETNAELDGFYAKYPRGQYAAIASDPGAAALFAQGKTLRTSIDGTLDRFAEGAGASAKELRRRYGSLLDVEGEAYRRSNVAKRQQPESLAEQFGAMHAAMNIARGLYKASKGHVVEGMADVAAGHAGRLTSKAIKESQTTDALITRAFKEFTGRPSVVPLPTRRPVAGALGPGATQMGPVPDPSFVRGVPAQPALSGRPRQLPEAQAPPRVFNMPGEVRPDPSRVGSVQAQPLAYEINPHVPAKQGVRVSQFAGDPEAARAALATPEMNLMLRRMLADLDTFEPVKGRVVTPDINARYDPLTKSNLPGGAEYVPGAAGSPVGDDIRALSDQHVGNGAIKQAIQEMLDGKWPTNKLHTSALDAAMGYLEKRSGYRGPSVPEEWLLPEPVAARPSASPSIRAQLGDVMQKAAKSRKDHPELNDEYRRLMKRASVLRAKLRSEQP